MDIDAGQGGDPAVGPARFGAVFLVCKACGKRGSGPKKLKPKDVAGLVRRASKGEAVRSRVLMATCLGLCPKQATALARVASGTPTRIVAIGHAKEVVRAVTLLSVVDTKPRTTLAVSA